MDCCSWGSWTTAVHILGVPTKKKRPRTTGLDDANIQPQSDILSNLLQFPDFWADQQNLEEKTYLYIYRGLYWTRWSLPLFDTSACPTDGWRQTPLLQREPGASFTHSFPKLCQPEASEAGWALQFRTSSGVGTLPHAVSPLTCINWPLLYRQEDSVHVDKVVA